MRPSLQGCCPLWSSLGSASSNLRWHPSVSRIISQGCSQFSYNKYIYFSNMETGFEKLFVKRGHPSDNVIDGELINVVTCCNKNLMAELFNIFSFFNLEKKDLVELVLQHSQVSSPLDATDSQSSRLSSSESYTDNGIRVSDQVRDDHLTNLTIHVNTSMN